jgi:hypothetical protein
MWVLSVDAGSLLSVVKFDQKKPGAKALADKHKATDPDVDYMLVRARVKASLGYVVGVLDAISEDIPGYESPIIESMPSADYKYRTIITRDEWKRYLMFEVDGIDYDSHVKEETVRRQPEPKVANLYSALSATWSAWAKLQDTPPYGAKTWTSGSYGKPDCKNCNHRELAHTIKGDKCSGQKDGMWTEAKQKTSTCTCTKYEPKPATKMPPPSAKAVGKSPVGTGQLAIGESAPDPVYPSAVYGSDWDQDDVIDRGVGCRRVRESPTSRGARSGTGTRASASSPRTTRTRTTGRRSGSGWVYQEPAKVPGESKRQRKARNERNRRRRVKAQQKSPAAS